MLMKYNMQGRTRKKFLFESKLWKTWGLNMHLQLVKTTGVGEGHSSLRAWNKKGSEPQNLGLVQEWLFFVGGGAQGP